MKHLTATFNNNNDRRQQSLTFVGRERREIKALIAEDLAQDRSNKAFLSGTSSIQDLKRLG